MPVLWAKFENATLRPGTVDWDLLIMSHYSTVDPLLKILYNLGRAQAMQAIFHHWKSYTSRAALDAYIAQEWPSERPPTPEEPVKVFDQTGGTAKESATGKAPLKNRIQSLALNFGRSK
jgi:hypothetical protein